MSPAEIRHELIRVTKQAYADKMFAATSGNLSYYDREMCIRDRVVAFGHRRAVVGLPLVGIGALHDAQFIAVGRLQLLRLVDHLSQEQVGADRVADDGDPRGLFRERRGDKGQDQSKRQNDRCQFLHDAVTPLMNVV